MTTGLVSNFYFLWVPQEVVFKGGVISNITNYYLLNIQFYYLYFTVLLFIIQRRFRNKITQSPTGSIVGYSFNIPPLNFMR